jgi:hypothetical protein
VQYNSHATQQDCVNEILKTCKATTGKYPLVDITRRFNFALDRYFTLAFQTDGRWKFDDVNQTDVPLETLNIVSGTNKYDMSQLTDELFQLFRIEFLDSNSNPILAEEEDFDKLKQCGLTFTSAYSTASTNQSVPSKYLKWGKFLYIRATPNYTLSAAIKFYFNRHASYMASTDTTKVPGVPVIHHQYLCRLAAQPYLDENNMSNSEKNQQLILQDEQAIQAHFAMRDKDVPPRVFVRRRLKI